MKKIFLFFFTILIFEPSYAQGISGGPLFNTGIQAKTCSICPVSDSEIQRDSLGYLIGKIPYDFYTAFNCTVKHPIDTVFLAEGSSFVMTAESTTPCFIITYGAKSNGADDDMQLFWIKKKDSDNIYRDTIEFTSNCYSFLRRIIVVNAKYALKKTVYDNMHIGPGTPMLPLETGSEHLNAVGTGLPGSVPHCSLDIQDVSFNRNCHIEGDLRGDNMYMFHSNVVANDPNIHYYDLQFPEEPFSIFTKNSTTDVEMFVIDEDNEIVAHCNNYTVSSDYDWGQEARADLTGNDSLKAVILLPYRSYLEQEDDYFFGEDDFVFQDSNVEGTTDLYLFCKFFTMQDMNYYFPNLRSNDALISAGPYSYNCHGWTAYPTQYLFRQPYLSGIHDANSIAYYLCHIHGFTEEGATEDNCDVDIWEHNGYATHTSVKSYGGGAGGHSYGYDWESKLGFNCRIMHPRYALENCDESNTGAYGHVVKHLIKAQNASQGNYIYENVAFTEEEKLRISDLSKDASAEEEENLSEKLARLEESLIQKCISNIGLLSLYDHDYQKLAETCSQKPALLGLLMNKMSEGNALAAYLFIDATKKDNEDVVKKIIDYESQNAVGNSGEHIIRLDIAEAILYAKELLAKYSGAQRPFMKEGVSYSNDNKGFSTSVSDNNVIISFSLENEAMVSMIIDDIQGYSFKQIIENDKLTSGRHQLNVSVDKSGIYNVVLSVNGCIYTKKIVIK